MTILENFSKTYQAFLFKMLSLRDKQREGRTLWFEFYNFGTPFKMRCTSTQVLRKFWLSNRQWSRCHLLSVSSTLLFTLSIAWHKCFDFG